ncbi:hypothetical protein [Verrucomicrobium spinosum]|uniref:hypothetical protein n=1 Tax=Verrucomicrobium spinosum TaxID=2736 RepID=UPI0002ED1E69|nr:hypothetical protein [Verrucomicrobium spinosum]
MSPDSLPAGSKVIALIHSDVDGYLNRVSRRDAKKARNRNQNAAEHFLGIKEYLKYHPPFLTIDPLEYEGRFDELALAVLAKAREASVKDPENA